MFSELNIVNAVLNQIRPAMEADGGGVDVTNIDKQNRTICIKFLGACINCPSQSLTFKFGIEKILKENFAWIDEVIVVK